jgi:hypothetical protein
MIDFLFQPSMNIPLRIHSFRKMFENSEAYHPRNLLKSFEKRRGTHNFYASAKLSEFDANENDWIIFEMGDEQENENNNNNQNNIPMQMKLLNRNSARGISRMEVYIGSVTEENNEWQKLHSQTAITNIEKTRYISANV